MGAIIGMAQDFVGSNNINLLKPNGNFGCLSPETLVLMWDGTLKMAQDIIIGDKLVGDDGTDRTVLKLTSGIDNMYEVVSENTFIANSEHILTLNFEDNNTIVWNDNYKMWILRYFDGTTIIHINKTDLQHIKSQLYKSTVFFEIVKMQEENYNKYKCSNTIDIKIKDYLKLLESDKTSLKLISNINVINWDKKDVSIDPYIFGKSINTNNIPLEYIINDKETRLKLLAGFIDNNDFCFYFKTRQMYRVKHSNYNLLNSIIFIAKSLGYYTKQYANVLSIYGNNLHEIPTKLHQYKQSNNNNNFNFHNFEVIHQGFNNFNGWQIDKNERFLLGNFIVTHNSIIKGGSDAASPRYIWTQFEDLTSITINTLDTPILNKQYEDNDPIEPEFYVPIIPMILVNGSIGIGTGFSTSIPPFNPLDIIKNLKLKLENKEMENMQPYWRGFNGTVYKIDDYNYEIYGNYSITDNKLIITELPVGLWTYNYKEYLEKLLEVDPKKKENKFIGYTDNNTDTKVYFELEFVDGYLETIKDIAKEFKLCKKISLTNLHLFNCKGTIQKYDNVNLIIDEYFNIRLEYYQKRKDYQLHILENELLMISYKVKFLLLIIDKKLIINNKKKIDLETELEELQFPKIDNTYNYLLGMQIYSLTKEKIDELKKKENEKQTEYDNLKKLLPSNIWLSELNLLEEKYKEWIDKKEVKTNNEKQIKQTKKKSKKIV